MKIMIMINNNKDDRDDRDEKVLISQTIFQHYHFSVH